jgi:formate dehydrogenase accessory protein FdhE
VSLASAASARWRERTARARLLAARHPESSALLAFYASLSEWQSALAGRMALALDAQPVAEPTVEALRPLALDALPELLRWLDRSAPADTRTRLALPHAAGLEPWRAALDGYLSDARLDDARTFVVEAVLQPLAELVFMRRPDGIDGDAVSDGRAAAPGAPVGPTRCPHCTRRPVVGAMREEGQGMRRSLVCGLCLHEWASRRLLCTACGEERFDALPVFTAEQFPHIRIEGCETCRHYLKTIDLARDGLAVPIVDDLASVALDLWARERGYVRLRPSLLRT